MSLLQKWSPFGTSRWDPFREMSRVRVAKAKNILINPNHRVSEAAYEVGFQSLTHFNRMFK